MTAHAPTLSVTPQGRRALFHLLVPRTRRHFTPAQIVTLAQTDETRARTSKKDAAVREEEIRKAASDGLLEFVREEGGRLARETGGSLVVGEIMLYAEGGQCLIIISIQSICLILHQRQDSSNGSSPAAIDIILSFRRSFYPTPDRPSTYLSPVQNALTRWSFLTLHKIYQPLPYILPLGICICLYQNCRANVHLSDGWRRWCIFSS